MWLKVNEVDIERFMCNGNKICSIHLNCVINITIVLYFDISLANPMQACISLPLFSRVPTVMEKHGKLAHTKSHGN